MARYATFLDARFRERALDEAEIEAWVAGTREALDAAAARACGEDVEELLLADLGRAAGKHARAARHAGLLDEARETWSRAIAIWQDLSREKALFLARLEHLVVRSEREEEGVGEEFAGLLARAMEQESLAVYEDFVREYLAIWHASRGRFEEGMAQLEQALELRIARGSARQIAQTRALLERFERGE